MVRTAGLFPGQGSQTPDMRQLVERRAPELLEHCIGLVGEDPFPRVSESTRYAQPAIYCASIAGWLRARARLRAAGTLTEPIAFAGHSLGELSALAAAGALEPHAGLELAARRGELMADAAAAGHDQGMLALLGADAAQAAELAAGNGVVVANDNAPGQLVVAGVTEQLQAVQADARAAGMRAIFLDVAGAFHTQAMAAAVEPFREALAAVEFGASAQSVISCASASPFVDPVAELAAAIVRPVRWRETMAALRELGAEAFLDFGPGTVLARLVHRNLPQAQLIDLDPVGRREASGVV